jgi:hypothetical protein
LKPNDVLSLIDSLSSCSSLRELELLEKRVDALANPSVSERTKQAELMRAKRRAERNLTVPPPQNPARRLAMEGDPEEWLRWYLSDRFYRPFTVNQRSVIAAIEERINFGGSKAIADSRGGGKTAITEGMSLKGILTGRLRYPLVLAANAGDAGRLVSNIKSPLETSDRLLADYPEVCVPVRDLEGAPQRGPTQIVDGEHTLLKWSTGHVRFPRVFVNWCRTCLAETVDGRCVACGAPSERWLSPASGAVLEAVGIFGKIRGRRHGAQRPDFVIADDIEDEEAATSAQKRTKILRVLENAVPLLAGPDKRIAIMMLCTIQNPHCVAAIYTDRSRKPAYSGERFRQVIRWPDRKDLWDRYIELRQDGKRSEADIDGRAATAFLVESWDEMHRGGEIANEHRFVRDAGSNGEPLELSAMQHVHNVAADRGWDTVFCEYQNDPPDEHQSGGIPKPEEVAKRKTNAPRFQVPPDCQAVTAFIDVGKDVLWYAVSAWSSPFGGTILDYGTFPDQRRRYFTSQELTPTLGEAYKAAHGVTGPDDAVIYWGLTQLHAKLSGQSYTGSDGRLHAISKGGVDSGWGEHTETVHRWIRQSGAKGLWLPTKGIGIGAKKKPMFMWAKSDGEQRSIDARIVFPSGRTHRLLEYDTNAWKTRVHSMLAVPVGAAGGLMLYGDARIDHRQIAAHLTSEYRVLVEANGRTVWEYSLPTDKPDNHWFDCLVGSAVLASFCGVTAEQGGEAKVKRVSALEAARKKGL